jgi:vacuolar-type H+-ATPase subunit E/Vma4
VTSPAAVPDVASAETPLDAQLRPVIAALLNDAKRRAAAILKEADEHASTLMDDARRQSEELLAAARADGAAAARREEARALADARRQSHERVLEAQRAVYEEVRSLAQNQLDRLAGSPAAKDLNARLEALARTRLGPHAVLELSPSGVGVIATDAERRLDLGRDALVERELAVLGPRILELWS